MYRLVVIVIITVIAVAVLRSPDDAGGAVAGAASTVKTILVAVLEMTQRLLTVLINALKNT
jgi:hypothetical protein